MSTQFSRRALLASAVFAGVAAPAAACAQTGGVYTMQVYRGAGCGCCGVWNRQLRESGRFTTTMTDDPNLAATKQRLGVPADLAGCHTAEVDGYVIEGHVPEADIVRLLTQRPAHVHGIAVPGMPLGSPGMEVADGRRDAYEVIAFHHDGGRSVFASYPALP